MSKYYRVPHGDWQSQGREGREKVEALVSQGWTLVNMFNADFDKHQRYLGEFRNIYDWVRENVGTGAEDWCCIDNFWLFKDVNKAMLFKLAWAGV